MTGSGWSPGASLVPQAPLAAERDSAGTLSDLPSWAACVAVAAALRFVAVLIVPVLPEESYHWLYAKHLDYGYYDHPPMVAWMIALGTALFGDSPLGLRLLPWLCSIGTATAAAAAANRLYGEKAAFWTALLLAFQPVTVIGSSFGFPDAGLLLFWSLGVLFAVRALQSGQGVWWLAVGACQGAALLSKYTAGFLGLSLVLYLLCSREDRGWLKSPWPWLGAILSLAVFSPVIAWNAHHDWASFRFQSVGRLEESSHPPRVGSALAYVFQQAGGALALTAPVAVGAIWVAFRRRSREQRLLLFLSLPLLLFFLAVSATRSTHVLWPLPAWIAVAILTGDYVARDPGRLASLLRLRWRSAATLLLVVAGIGLAHSVRPLPGLAPLRHVSGWAEVARRAEGLRAGLEPGAFYLAVGRRYVCPSQLAFHVRDPREVHSKNLLGEEGLQFTYWDDPAALAGHDAVIVAEDNWSPRLEELLRRHFETVSRDGVPLSPEGSGTYSGRQEERYVFYVGRGYRPNERP